jgi:hypothetical protein
MKVHQSFTWVNEWIPMWRYLHICVFFKGNFVRSQKGYHFQEDLAKYCYKIKAGRGKKNSIIILLYFGYTLKTKHINLAIENLQNHLIFCILLLNFTFWQKFIQKNQHCYAYTSQRASSLKGKALAIHALHLENWGESPAIWALHLGNWCKVSS